jgi:uncharacterized integral membrane protein
MSVLNRSRRAPAEAAEPVATVPPQEPPQEPVTEPRRPPARTRLSAAWVGACLGAVVLVVLIVFMLQNTGSVEVSFLGMHGSLPLALALLIAAVGASLLTMTVAAARITQLRRRIGRRS